MEIDNTFEKMARRIELLPRKAPKPVYQHTCYRCRRTFTSHVPEQKWCSGGCRNRNKMQPQSKPARAVSPEQYQAYIRSDDWRQKAERAKKRAGYTCQVCNHGPSDGRLLEAHHRTYARLGNEQPLDITVLCDECHGLFSKHGNLAR